MDRFSAMPGLRLKGWISDERTNRWGAVLLGESVAAAEVSIPVRAAELIGYPSAHTYASDVEATAEEDCDIAQLA